MPGEPPTPPGTSIIATDLAMLVQRAAHAVALTVTDPKLPGDRDGLVLRFGTQIDTQPLQPNRDRVPVRSRLCGRAGRWRPI